jgi:hypothetical protein
MPTRSAADPIARSTNGATGRTLNRKTSLLRIVPTACGQAADIAWRRSPAARRFSSPCDATTIHARRLRIGRDVAVAIDSRSDPTSSRCQISRTHPRPWPRRVRKMFLCGRDEPTGGARRDRTDDLLLAKQALSQLSYGPSSIGDQSEEERARRSLAVPRLPIPESGGPGKI